MAIYKVGGRPVAVAFMAIFAGAFATVPARGGTSNIVQSYAGISLQDVYNVNGGQGFTPPDVNGAVGPGNVIEFVNGAVAVYDKTSGAQQSLESNTAFWNNAGISSSLTSLGLTDPRTLYDPSINRYITTELTLGGTTVAPTASPNNVLIAVSNTGDPTAGWRATSFAGIPSGTANANSFLDFDTLGVNANGVYVGGNLFNNGTFAGPSLFAIPKSSLTALGGPTTTGMTRFDNPYGGNALGTFQPVVSPSSMNSEVVLSNDANGTIYAASVTNVASTALLSASVPTSPPATENPPPPQQQPTPNDLLDAGDLRISATTTQVGNDIYAVQAVANSANSLPALHYSVINATTFAVIDQGTIQYPNNQFGYAYPSIAANPNGNVVIGFTRSGISGTDTTANPMAGNAGAYAVIGQTVGGILTFGSPFALQQGLVNNYSLGANSSNVSRWGDYTTTMVDPNNPNAFWTIQEYASASNSWGTQITEIALPEPASLVAGASGLVALVVLRRRRRPIVIF